jgi:hypothetical protein
VLRFAPFLVIAALEIFCLVDVLTTDEDRVRSLPKIAWFLLILFFPLVGSVVWLVAGRPQTAGSGRSPYERTAPAYPEYDRPGRAAGLTPESDEEFLRKVRERAEEQRRRYAEEQRAREQKSGESAGEAADDDPTP